MEQVTRYFVTEVDGVPHTLARVHGNRAAERLVVGGEWESYPNLVRLAIGDDLTWDEIDAATAGQIERQLLAAKAS